jgi:hypothetical protein
MWNTRVTRTLVLTLALVAAGATAAQAHEVVEVGPLQLVVGFGDEPAYTGQPNNVSVLISRDDHPVTDARGLEVEVSFGDASTVLPLETFGDTGDYRASFIPSQPGDYTFHIRGRVEGQRIDEELTSGPSTFSAVEDPSSAAFPPVDTPSNDELAARIETESSKTAEAVSAVQAADRAAADARSTAVIGIVVGSLGVIAAIGALAVARRR